MARTQTHISITELILYYLLELFDRRIAERKLSYSCKYQYLQVLHLHQTELV